MPDDDVLNVSTIGSAGEAQAELLDDGGNPIIKKASAPSLERQAFVDGLFHELDTQLHHHLKLVEQYSRLSAQIMISERTVRMTRDHLNWVLTRSEDAVPLGWNEVLAKVRFIGMRLGDACMRLLEEYGTLTSDEMRKKLDMGQFRFRSGSPLREINAALLRQSNVKKEEDRWTLKGGKKTKEG